MRHLSSFLPRLITPSLLLMALVTVFLVSGCTSMGLTGSENYQYYGGWGLSQRRHFVPSEVRRVEPWLGGKRATGETGKTRAPSA